MHNKSFVAPSGWLAFEINILRRLKFKSAALPSGGETVLGTNLKRWNVRVSTNDFLQSAWTKAVAEIENANVTLSGEDVSAALEDVYVPRHRLQNPALQSWFGETEAWWFDNIRQNIERLSSPIKKAIASKIAMNVGDYALSFTEETRELRQPLSNVFQRLSSIKTDLFDNGQENICANKSLNDFIAENPTDLIFLRLPPRRTALKNSLGGQAWREEWIRGSDDFWSALETSQTGKLGSRVESGTQYLQLLEDILKTASHIPLWAIAHNESGFITTEEVVETINRVRRVETVFTKDFSELTGTKAVIITA
ncbi:MAG: hypothetical protein ACR2LT_04910 [Pyrinomonadaceae bacterium]